jgi:TetR/AcrR family transcriptional regulator
VSHNLINRRFGSKERLWRAAVDRWFGALVDALAPSATVDGAGDPLERLREFVVTFIEVNARRPEMAGLMNVEASSPQRCAPRGSCGTTRPGSPSPRARPAR